MIQIFTAIDPADFNKYYWHKEPFEQIMKNQEECYAEPKKTTQYTSETPTHKYERMQDVMIKDHIKTAIERKRKGGGLYRCGQ